MSKTVFIFGFHHSGTTILRTILGHIEGAKTFLPEADPTDQPDFAKDATLRVFKNPEVKEEYFSDAYRDIVRIFLVRDPLQVLSSCNRRYRNDPQVARRTAENYLRMSSIFVRTRENPPPTLHHIRYEDMFQDGHKAIRDALDRHGIKHDDSIFQNQLRKNVSHKGQTPAHTPRNRPKDTDHELLRLYQMNQPFQDNNDPSKVHLLQSQIDAIRSDPLLPLIYPDLAESIRYHENKPR